VGLPPPGPPVAPVDPPPEDVGDEGADVVPPPPVGADFGDVVGRVVEVGDLRVEVGVGDELTGLVTFGAVVVGVEPVRF
jgi:hypothetical protein